MKSTLASSIFYLRDFFNYHRKFLCNLNNDLYNEGSRFSAYIFSSFIFSLIININELIEISMFKT